MQARRNEKILGAGNFSKNVDQLGSLTKKIVQVKSFKMSRNTF